MINGKDNTKEKLLYNLGKYKILNTAAIYGAILMLNDNIISLAQEQNKGK